MGRASILINVEDLTHEIRLREKDALSVQDLFQKIADSAWGGNLVNSVGATVRPSWATLANKAKTAGVQLNVPQRERSSNPFASTAGKVKVRKKKQIPESSVKQYHKLFPDNPKLIDRMCKGSKTAGIKLMCIDCCGSAAEARRCDLTHCPLFYFSPFTKKD